MRYKAASVDIKEIGHRVRSERQSLGWSQDELIDWLKKQGTPLSRGTLSKIENGGMLGFSLDLLISLCNLFDCDMGYLLCEYNERHRVTAEVCAQTGLSEGAAIRLGQENHMEKNFSRVLWDSLLPLEVMSKLLCDEEFWRVLYYLSSSTTSTALEFSKAADKQNAYLQVPLIVDGVDMRPFADPINEMCIASATIHFGNAVRRVLGWEAETEVQKIDKEVDNVPEYPDTPCVDLNSMVDDLQQIMNSEK